MTRQEKSRGPNDPCSCGSGRKYKNCCMHKAVKSRPRRVRQIIVYMLLLGAASAVVALALQPRDGVGGATPAGGSASDGTPANYEYDAVNDRYWHAVDGGHWHAGRPPAGSTTGVTPAQWEYDAVNDRHWHNGHWDSGPPPVGRQ